MCSRKIQKITSGQGLHWVGDGFLVNTLFSYNHDNNTSPFLLLDYAAPVDFEPTTIQRGVGLHPHRGFETVTIVYEGEISHQDTAGNSGTIKSGDVQWMTAASGILHEEKHSEDFMRHGGKFEMVQLWVNLPAKYKMSPPRYQEITKQTIPVIKLNNDTGSVRVIAGEFDGIKGAAKTFTPIHLYDCRLITGASLDIEIEPGFHAMLLLLDGQLSIAGDAIISSELCVLEPQGSPISIVAHQHSKFLFLSGEPINEPIAGAGPFVMNTKEEIYQAFEDYKTGQF